MNKITCACFSKNIFSEVTVTLLEPNNENQKDAVFEYDGTLSNHNRTEFLEFLFSQTTVYVARRVNEENDEVVVGYIVASKTDNRVLALYADDQSVADTLLSHHLQKSNAKKVRCDLGLEKLIFNPIYLKNNFRQFCALLVHNGAN